MRKLVGLLLASIALDAQAAPITYFFDRGGVSGSLTTDGTASYWYENHFIGFDVTFHGQETDYHITQDTTFAALTYWGSGIRATETELHWYPGEGYDYLAIGMNDGMGHTAAWILPSGPSDCYQANPPSPYQNLVCQERLYIDAYQGASGIPLAGSSYVFASVPEPGTALLLGLGLLLAAWWRS